MPPEPKLAPGARPEWCDAAGLHAVALGCDASGDSHLCQSTIAVTVFEALRLGQQRGDWWIRFAVLVPDRLHLLAAFAPTRAVRAALADFKAFVTQAGLRWQDELLDHVAGVEGTGSEVVRRMRLAPVRARLVAESVMWPFAWDTMDFASPAPNLERDSALHSRR